MLNRSVADIEGPWRDPNFDSGLIRRLEQSWCVPITKLTNQMLATYLRQNVAVDEISKEASKRLASGFDDNSELYEGELAKAVHEFSEQRNRK